MTSSEELQRLYFETLTGDPVISPMIGGVYDAIPRDPFAGKSAYISFGPNSSVEDDADCISGQRVTTQIDIWSRSSGSIECKTLVDLVRQKLHRGAFELAENALAETWVSLTRVFRDPDGLTTHGVVQVTATIEEP